jgi:hypothetical protein
MARAEAAGAVKNGGQPGTAGGRRCADPRDRIRLGGGAPIARADHAGRRSADPPALITLGGKDQQARS